MELFGVARSRATRNLWLLYEAGQAFERVPVIQADRADRDTQALNTRSPEFLAISPAGAVPVLRDGDLVIAESLAINLYLARKFGAPLGPKDAAEDAQMLQWSLFAACSIEPYAVEIMYAHAQGRATTPGGRAEIAAMKSRLERPLSTLNAHLAAGHMVGGRFTAADINVAEIVRYAGFEPGLLDAYPAVKSWYEACHARAAFQRMWADRMAEPA